MPFTAFVTGFNVVADLVHMNMNKLNMVYCMFQQYTTWGSFANVDQKYFYNVKFIFYFFWVTYELTVKKTTCSIGTGVSS